MDETGQDRGSAVDQGDVDDAEQQPLGSRIMKSTGLAALTVMVVLAGMHVILPPVGPKQKTPTPHPGGACVVCHWVSQNAAPIEVK